MHWFFGTLVAIVTAIGIYVGSALVSLNGLATAARAGDGAAVLERTDMACLRRSLVDQIVSAYLRQVLNRLSPLKPVEFLVRLGDTESAGGVSIHFEGNGWKLSGIQLPAAAAQILAQSLIDNKGRKG
jgi:hypothetical protein